MVRRLSGGGRWIRTIGTRKISYRFEADFCRLHDASRSRKGFSAADPDRLILPAMQQAKQPVWTRLQLLARLTLNPGKHAGNQPARLAHLDDGYDRAILVQGDEGPAQNRCILRSRRRTT